MSHNIVDLLMSVDVFGIQETWDIDYTYLESYLHDNLIFPCKAKKSIVGGRHMGGVIVGVKNNVSNFVERVCDEFEHGVILIFDKAFLSSEINVLYANIYVPPANSPSYEICRVTVIQKLEECLAGFNLANYELLLCGDFNVRTANLVDYTECSDSIPEFQDVFEILDGDLGRDRIAKDNKVREGIVDILQSL